MKIARWLLILPAALVAGGVFAVSDQVAAEPPAGAMRAAIFVQNRAGLELENKLDAFDDMIAARLKAAGFAVVNHKDVVQRFAESRNALDRQAVERQVELLPRADKPEVVTTSDREIIRKMEEWTKAGKSEGSVDETVDATSALRLAQMLNVDYLVFASIVSVGSDSREFAGYGVNQQVTSYVMRLALRVLEGAQGSLVYGDVVTVTEKTGESAGLQMVLGDVINKLLDDGAVQLADRVKRSAREIQAAKTDKPATVEIAINSNVEGATVEIDGAAVGSAPGKFNVRPGIHQVRITKEWYATWEKNINATPGQVLMVAMEMTPEGLARQRATVDTTVAGKVGEGEAKVLEGEAKMRSESYWKMQGNLENLTIQGDQVPQNVNVLKQEQK